ncbi:MAG: T9SS type A sorting domain-containing protein [Saprospiraceae bacterium]|nr:T9SS type A sorting domain-containing protein [Saprospiraceae bacterium]
MRNSFPTLLLGLLLPFFISAQTTPRIFCGNELFTEMVETQYPDLAESINRTFDKAKILQAGPRTTLTIPVVVHVVWNLPEENLTDELIEAQIQVLNDDFNRMNADTGNLRSMFEWVAGSADIKFELVATERINTSTLFNIDILSGNLIPEVKHTLQGGSDGWNTENYLNIWVCNIQPLKIGPIVVGQILGFAFPPADLDNWPAGSNAPNADEDGVVIDYRVFGPDNPNPVEIPGGTSNLVVKGRTPTHEVAHYLGLRHIWGDGGTFGPNDCMQSDGVNDTPFADSESAFDCDITKNTCTGIDSFYGLDMPDLVENYMDYASEDCMNMFTKGQVEIMRNVVMGPRSGLLEMVAVDDVEPFAPLMTLQPNPASESVLVWMETSITTASALTLTDLFGRVLLHKMIPAGTISAELPLQDVPGGLYFVHLENNQFRQISKLIVNRN